MRLTTALRRADSSHDDNSLVGFDDIALLDVVKALNRQTAFVTGRNFPDVVFEAF
jgi:hypothetical protein